MSSHALTGVTIQCVTGAEVGRWLGALAALRIAVFREWPYLYAGDLAYEQRYLEAYARSNDAVFVLAIDGERVVGASSGLPLADDESHFSKPFIERGIGVDPVFYFGESVLLPAYRGKGLGHAFFDAREAHALRLGRFTHTAFCSVDRDEADLRRPANARRNDAFWEQRGYRRQAHMQCHVAWREIGGVDDVMHSLTFWLRSLSKAGASA